MGAVAVRTLSVNFLDQLHSVESGDPVFMLLTLSHDDLPAPVRIVNSPAMITSRGNEFTPLAFDCTLGVDDGETMPSVTLTLDNIDSTIISILRSLTSAPTILIEVVLGSAPDAVEIAIPRLELTNAKYDASQITVSLTMPDIMNRRFPADDFNPAQFPGLFR